MRPLWRDSRGQVLVLLALMLVVLIGIAALALDGGMAYGVKAKMNAAADAAAVAALRERTSPLGTRESASMVASNYFNANFPADSMGIPHPSCSVDITTKNGAYVATVEATAVVPTLFARVIGWRGLTLTARSEATRGNVDVALVLDTSGSLTTSWGSVRPTVQDFVNRFSEDNDRVAFVPFGDGVGLRDSGGTLVLTAGTEINPCTAAPRFRRDSVNTKMDAIVPRGDTATETGIRIGLDQLNKVPVGSRASRRAIILFSDGAPNTFTGAFLDTTGRTLNGSLWSGKDSGTASDLYRTESTSEKFPDPISLARVPSTGGGEPDRNGHLRPGVGGDAEALHLLRQHKPQRPQMQRQQSRPQPGRKPGASRPQPGHRHLRHRVRQVSRPAGHLCRLLDAQRERVDHPEENGQRERRRHL